MSRIGISGSGLSLMLALGLPGTTEGECSGTPRGLLWNTDPQRWDQLCVGGFRDLDSVIIPCFPVAGSSPHSAITSIRDSWHPISGARIYGLLRGEREQDGL